MWGKVLPKPCIVIKNILYYPVSGCHILAFDLERKSFARIPPPPAEI